MDVNIVGVNRGITDRFRSYVEEKAGKVAHLADRAQSLDVKLTCPNERNGIPGPDRVELTLVSPGPLVRAEADGTDKYAAFDVALSRLLERVRRAKDRRKVHRGSRRPTSLREAAEAGFAGTGVRAAEAEVLERVRTGEIPVVADADNGHHEDDEVYSPVVIRRKVFTSAAMTVDDALSFMELVGHDFYLFVDAETGRPSVVYRRKGWDYGLIGLEQQADDATLEASPLERATA